LRFIGTGSPDAVLLAQSLGAEPMNTSPAPPAAERWAWAWDWGPELEAWSRELAALAPVDEVVVCTWPEPAPDAALVDLEPVEWRRQVEWPSALWFSALVAAAGSCRDGGSVVVVVDRPATLDAVGRIAAVTVAEGVTNVVRSLAAREGGRAVRVNAVLTAIHTDPSGLLGSPPPLATFPGRIDVEVAGAVRLLLSEDAAGVTGTALSSTAGRR
jgi:NAD(P)-dependent dehydrogenase (short-subunit alcohol dehydrogenase family)